MSTKKTTKFEQLVKKFKNQTEEDQAADIVEIHVANINAQISKLQADVLLSESHKKKLTINLDKTVATVTSDTTEWIKNIRDAKAMITAIDDSIANMKYTIEDLKSILDNYLS